MNMKFALAAGVCAAALAGFSDVTSANVVGYLGTATPSGGNKMIAPTFDTVGSEKAFKLSDLKGDGYDKEEGAMGELCLIVLTPGGSEAVFTAEEAAANPALTPYVGMKKTFFWFDGGWMENEPGWYNGDGDFKWDADAITFTAGDSFWSIGYGQSVVSAGQVGINCCNSTLICGNCDFIANLEFKLGDIGD